MREVANETYIPSDDVAKIKQRLINHINSMNDADLRTVAKSEASFKTFVVDSFKSIAKLFGYVVGKVVSFGQDISKLISSKPSRVFRLEKAPQNVPKPDRSKAIVLKLEKWD